MANKEEDGTVKLTITFMKIGSGMLKLSKVSNKVKQRLNIKSEVSNPHSGSTQSNNNPSSLDKKSYLSFQTGFFPYYKNERDSKTTPIFSLRYEAGIGARFGLLFHLGYGHNEGSYTRIGSPFWGGYTQLIQWDYNHVTFGTSLVFYPVKKEKVDVYALGGIGLGYKLERIGIGFDTKLNLKAGIRYHFSEKVSAYSEFGLGLSKFNLGLSYTI
jgi:hypothetical protein